MAEINSCKTASFRKTQPTNQKKMDKRISTNGHKACNVNGQ